MTVEGSACSHYIGTSEVQAVVFRQLSKPTRHSASFESHLSTDESRSTIRLEEAYVDAFAYRWFDLDCYSAISMDLLDLKGTTSLFTHLVLGRTEYHDLFTNLIIMMIPSAVSTM